MTSGRARWPVLAVLVLVLTATALRTRAAARPGLWVDEIFSLAMATGHSLEHPAADADSTLGDFVQPAGAEPPGVFRRYTELGETAAGPARVVRAVLLSDTNPPLYYLLLNLWMRAAGTSDASLRLFSVLCSLLALPFLWLIGRALGGERCAWAASVLFSLSPVASYYSVEGRMYSLLWVLVLALTWLTLRLAEDGKGRRLHSVLWGVTGAAGLLTHYFFAFVWVASLAWLWLTTPLLRRRVALLAALTALAILPWYAQVPASIARWRVTGDWLVGALEWPGALARPFSLARSLVASWTDLGGWRWGEPLLGAAAAALVVGLALGKSWGSLLSRPAGLVWASLAAACVGPLVFDLTRQTTTSMIPRYALPGLPAALLLTALALSRLPARLHRGVLGMLMVAWLPGTWKATTAHVPRPRQPYRQLDARIASWAQPGDVVLVRSIPSGVVGVARYLRPDIPLVAWVTQLGTRRVPADLERVLRGRRGVAVVTIHDAGARDDVDPWLRANARLIERDTFPRSSAELLYFAPATGDTFFAEVAGRWD